MLDVLERDRPGLAAIYLRGSGPPRASAFHHLRRRGYDVTETKVGGALWALRIAHPTLGGAELWADPSSRPLGELIRSARNLSPAERAVADPAASAVLLRVPARRGDVLRDRKDMLRIAAAVLGDQGVMVVDLASQVPWSPAALAEELAHDAALDFEALYAIHGVSSGVDAHSRVDWLHTHGLGALGATDIDILGAHPEFAAASADPFRAIAILLLEGAVAPDEERFRFGYPGGDARLVPVGEFMRSARAGHRSLRAAADHDERRSVLCEPDGRRFLRRLRGDGAARPLELPQAPPPARFVVFFPASATTMMAERARGTLAVLRARQAEFAAYRPTPLVKLGYPTEDGGQEHLWFEAHGFTDGTVDATLQNTPLGVDLRPGERAERPLDLLTDWALVTPAGWITPRSSIVTRRLREEPDRHRGRVDASR